VTRLDWAALAAPVHEFIISEFHVNKEFFQFSQLAKNFVNIFYIVAFSAPHRHEFYEPFLLQNPG
jgi:hypothetical protein